jgi:hypothetical protein
MPDSVLPALCGHCFAANGAFGREAGLSFSTFSFNDSEFHLFFLSMANRLLEAGCFECAGLKRSAFCWFLLLVSVGQRNSVAGC